jgi:hypothetical protein
MNLATKTIEALEVIDSRDIIERIDALQNLENVDEADKEELAALLKLQEDCTEYSNDWEHGESLIRNDYFTDYMTSLINECYELPKELTSGEWPYRHVSIDYQAAADEARYDYAEVEFMGETYLIRCY